MHGLNLLQRRSRIGPDTSKHLKIKCSKRSSLFETTLKLPPAALLKLSPTPLNSGICSHQPKSFAIRVLCIPLPKCPFSMNILLPPDRHTTHSTAVLVEAKVEDTIQAVRRCSCEICHVKIARKSCVLHSANSAL